MSGKTRENELQRAEGAGGLSCKAAREMIVEHYTHELDAASNAKVEAHFDACESCCWHRISLTTMIEVEIDRGGLREETDRISAEIKREGKKKWKQV